MTDKPTLLLAITKASWGGAQKYVYDLADAYQDTYDVHVLYGKNEFDGQDIFSEKLDALNVTTKQLPSLGRDPSLLDDLRSVRSMYRYMRKVSPKVVHLNSSKLGIMGGIVANLARVPTRVYTAHGFPFLDTSRAAWKNTIIKSITRFGLIFCNRIITISRREYNIVQSWKESRTKVHLVYNGIESPEIVDRTIARQELLQDAPQAVHERVSQGAPILGNIAELRPNKGVHILLAALRELARTHDFVYIHIGTGEEEAYLRTLVQEYGLEEQVYFAGFVSDASRYIPAFDLFVLSSLQEGTPYVLAEAGLAHSCVVATRVGAVDEMVEDGESGRIVSPGDASALAQAIADVLDDPVTQEQYKQALHRHITKRFSYEKMIAQTQTVYES